MLSTVSHLWTLFQILFWVGASYAYYLFSSDYGQAVGYLADRLSRLNILYVKIFQAIASNHEWVDEETNNRLLKFTDSAPWTYEDIDLSTLVSVAHQLDLHLPCGYERPINSGMISLVFKAHYQGFPERKVAIKMKRRNIQDKLDDAIENLLFMVKMLSFVSLVDKWQLANIIQKNVDMIRRQTNFAEEIDNMERIRENCRHIPYVVIPKAVAYITDMYPNVIVMNFIHGMKIDELEQEDYEPFAKLVVKFGLVTSVIHGVVHGDLHAGNVLFIKDPLDKDYPRKLGVIDFGIIFEVDDRYKTALFDILTQLFETSPRETAERILNEIIVAPKDALRQLSTEDYENIMEFATEMVIDTIYESKHANQIQIYRLLSRLKIYLEGRELQTLGIRPSDEFVKGQLVLAMAHGITLTLCKGNFIELMDKCLNELFHIQVLMADYMGAESEI